MSTYAFARAWQHSTQTGGALLTLLAMADAADHEEMVALPHDVIAARARLHISTVSRAICALEEAGEIVLVEPKSGRAPAKYRIKDALNTATAQIALLDDLPDPAAEWSPQETEPAALAAAPAEALLPANDAEPGPDEGGGTDTTFQDEEEADATLLEGMSMTAGELISGLTFQDEEEADEIPAGVILRRQNVNPEPIRQQLQEPRILPKHLPPGDLGTVLAALGVKEGARGTLFWWQREHRAALATLLEGMAMTAGELVSVIEDNHIKAPDLNRVADIEALVR